jgi:DNA-binding response OmpR family regulator
MSFSGVVCYYLDIDDAMINTILVVEDDKSLQEYLKELLLDNNYSVKVATDGVAALKLIKKTQPDLILLDLGLPNVSGETVCLEVRKNFPDIPVVILTARDSVSDVVRGLDLGADDYITKPFAADELLARVKARLRGYDSLSAKMKVADLEIDNKTYEVRRGGKLIDLTPQEFKLLQYLIHNKGRVLTRDMILNRIWLYSPDIETRVVDVYMGYLRKKIDGKAKKKLLRSIRGFGYMIKE